MYLSFVKGEQKSYKVVEITSLFDPTFFKKKKTIWTFIYFTCKKGSLLKSFSVQLRICFQQIFRFFYIFPTYFITVT